MRSSIALVTILTGFLFCLHTHAETPPTTATLDFSKAWFQPELLINKSPACNGILREVKKAFFENDTYLLTYFYKKNQQSENGKASNIGYAQFDPVTIDNKIIYLRSVTHRGCGGACEAHQLIASQSPFLEITNYAEDIAPAVIENAPEATNGTSSLFYPYENGSYFVYTITDTFKVYQLKPDASWENICIISTQPVETQKNKFSKVFASIKRLNENVNSLLGEEGPMCGTLQTLSRRRGEVKRSLPVAAYRPWAIHEIQYDDSPYATDIEHLENWALSGISQKIAFDEYKKQLEKTTAELSEFYQSQYGWKKSPSDQLAYKSLTTAIGSGMRFYNIQSYGEKQKELLDAIAQQSSLSKIKALIDDPDAMSEHVLNLSINQPDLLRYLLSKNTNANEQNEFNKSLLMYAAQYNQLASAKTLLKSGADTNLFTIIPSDDCSYRLSKSGMTALHYAVRYASFDFIKLLLNNGAFPYAKTSEKKGGYPIDWLHKYSAENAQEKNANITKEQVAELETLLALPTQEEAEKRALAFNLAAEQAFHQGNLNLAYQQTKKALGLNSTNERALSNLSLIALKMGKYWEALEASQQMIASGKGSSEIANAWFNYGLNCESNKIEYERYNGNTYCDNYPLYYFLESYKIKPTTARAAKILATLRKGGAPNCQFLGGKINILNNLSIYGAEKNLYLLAPKDANIDVSNISWKHTKEITQADKSVSRIKIIKHPENLLKTYDLGSFTLRIFNSDEKVYRPIQYLDEVCNDRDGVLPIK